MRYSFLTVFVLSAISLFFISLDDGDTSPYHPGVERSGGAADVLNQDRTGSPVSVGTCAACHGGGSFAPNINLSVINADGDEVDSYIPGATYTMNFNVTPTAGSPSGYAMQGVALDDANLQAGTFGIPTTANTQITALSGRNYIEHSGTAAGGASYTFSAPWTAPTAGTGDVNLYFIGLAVNSNGGTSGDSPSAPVSTSLAEEEITGFSYSSTSFCDNETTATPTITGDDTGTFAASEAGLDLDALSGVISPADSDPGTYTVTYTFGEPAETVETEITILESFTADAAIEICAGESVEFGGELFTADDAGLNSVLLTATNGCDSLIALTVNVIESPEVVATASDTEVCLGDDVVFTGTGTAASYAWSDGVTDGVGQEMTIAGVNTFTVTGVNASGCEATDEIIITVSDLILAGTVTNEVDGADGAIDLAVISGIAPYAYDWDIDGVGDFDDTEDLTGLTAGVYTVLVIDDFNCQRITSFTIKDVASLYSIDNAEIAIFPNPAFNELNLVVSGVFDYQITDVKGNVVLSGTAKDQTTLPIENAERGVYFIRIMVNGTTGTYRFVKE